MENIGNRIQNIRVGTHPEIETRLEHLKTQHNYFFKLVVKSRKSLEELRTIKVKYLDEKFKNYPEDVSKYSGSKEVLEISGWKIVEAFLNIYLDNLEFAEFNIAESKVFVNNCVTKGFMDEDYKSGYDYLNKLTEHYLKLKRNNPDVDFECTSYAYLPPKGKAAVISAKIACTSGVLYEDDFELVEEIVDMDPEYWVWNYLLCKRIRGIRRVEHSQPERREREAIISAVRLAPPDYSNYCKASYCLCLAEILKYRNVNCEDGLFAFGANRFANNDALYQFIKKECSAIIEQIEDGRPYFGECLRVAEIFSSILPTRLRNYDLAEKSFLKAEKIRPGSSKFHHQFAKLYINQKKYTKASERFNLSVRYDPANFSAWLHFTNSLHKFGRLETIDASIQKIMDDSDTTEDDLAHVLMVRGYSQFLRSKDEDGLESLMKSFASDPAACERGMERFKSYRRDFQSNVIGLKYITDFLRKKGALDKEEKKLVEVISKLEGPNSNHRR